MAALGLVRAGDLLQEPGALPGVAGGQHGEGGAGQEPWEAPRGVGGLLQGALQLAVAEGVGLEQVQALLVGEQALSLLRRNTLYRRVRTGI